MARGTAPGAPKETADRRRDDDAPGVLPRITVVTPSFNQGAFIERTLLSIAEQEYENLEYIVMDGGSTDDSVPIIRRHLRHITRWTSGPDGGQAAAINAAWRTSTGEVLTWLNSDDSYLPGTLQRIGAWFRDHPHRSFVYGQCVLVDRDGREIQRVGRPYSRRTMLLSHQPIPQPSAFLRRRLVDEIGMLDEDLHYVMDYDLFLRAAEIEPPAFLAEPLSRATVHPAAKTIAGRARMVAERQAIRRKSARGPEVLAVSLQPIASAAYHALPLGLRRSIDRLRPPRSVSES